MIWTIIVAMLCVAGLEAYALYLGVNGVILSLAVAAIAGLGGFEIKAIKDKVKGGK